jgi:serine/threonine protein kinase
LYYAITGKVPFPGGNAKSKARRHLEETPWHPRRFNPEVSDEFVDLIGDMMEKDPRERIQSAAEVAERLAPWASDQYLVPDISNVRPRWSTTGYSADGEQDTDPGSSQPSDGSEGSGSHSGSLQTGSSSGDSTIEKLRPPALALRPPSAPPPVYASEGGRTPRMASDEIQFSLTWVVIIGMACVGVGTVVGLLVALGMML